MRVEEIEENKPTCFSKDYLKRKYLSFVFFLFLLSLCVYPLPKLPPDWLIDQLSAL